MSSMNGFSKGTLLLHEVPKLFVIVSFQLKSPKAVRLKVVSAKLKMIMLFFISDIFNGLIFIEYNLIACSCPNQECKTFVKLM